MTTTEIEKAKAALERAVLDVELHEKANTRNPMTDRDCRVFIDEHGRAILSALQAPFAPAEMGGGVFARAICESEGRNWLALDNPRADCERWLKAGDACAALLAAPAPDAEKAEIARLTLAVKTATTTPDLQWGKRSPEGDWLASNSRDALADCTVHFEGEIVPVIVREEDGELIIEPVASARAAAAEGQVAALVEGLRKAEYALRKDSLCDAERVSSARSTITELLARIQPALNGQEAGR